MAFSLMSRSRDCVRRETKNRATPSVGCPIGPHDRSAKITLTNSDSGLGRICLLVAAGVDEDRTLDLYEFPV
jgi:hypothetical protein